MESPCPRIFKYYEGMSYRGSKLPEKKKRDIKCMVGDFIWGEDSVWISKEISVTSLMSLILGTF